MIKNPNQSNPVHSNIFLKLKAGRKKNHKGSNKTKRVIVGRQREANPKNKEETINHFNDSLFKAIKSCHNEISDNSTNKFSVIKVPE